MKTRKQTLFGMVLLAVVMLCAAGCTKPDDENNDNSGDGGNSGGGSQITYEYVDLGLPSGTLWATSNVGAASPEEYGDYFAWGETQPKEYYDWNNYNYCRGDWNTLTKYCSNPNYGYNGFTDTLTILQASDDAATANCGEGWRTPTKDEWEELITCCTQTWIIRDGINGKLFVASNGNSVFLPAAGCQSQHLEEVGSIGYYGSSSLQTNRPDNAWFLEFDSDHSSMDQPIGWRYYGQPVRPVCSSLKR